MHVDKYARSFSMLLRIEPERAAFQNVQKLWIYGFKRPTFGLFLQSQIYIWISAFHINHFWIHFAPYNNTLDPPFYVCRTFLDSLFITLGSYTKHLLYSFRTLFYLSTAKPISFLPLALVSILNFQLKEALEKRWFWGHH